MKVSDQVVSLDQAKKLKELGVKQEGATFYYDEEDGNDLQYNGSDYDIDSPDYGWSAFTVAELGMMLPDGNQLRGENNIAQFNTFRHIRNNKWSCCADYSSPRMSTEYGDVYEVWKEFEGNTQAECMAEMLIYIIEGSLIDVDKINSRI